MVLMARAAVMAIMAIRTAAVRSILVRRTAEGTHARQAIRAGATDAGVPIENAYPGGTANGPKRPWLLDFSTT